MIVIMMMMMMNMTIMDYEDKIMIKRTTIQMTMKDVRGDYEKDDDEGK